MFWAKNNFFQDIFIKKLVSIFGEKSSSVQLAKTCKRLHKENKMLQINANTLIKIRLIVLNLKVWKIDSDTQFQIYQCFLTLKMISWSRRRLTFFIALFIKFNYNVILYLHLLYIWPFFNCHSKSHWSFFDKILSTTVIAIFIETIIGISTVYIVYIWDIKLLKKWWW